MKVVFAESVVISTTQIPDGFFCIRYYDGLEKEWLDLINSSGEFGIWNIDDLKSRILDDIIPQGGILVLAGDRYVACAAICDRNGFYPYALLMYVIVERQYRGLGLGKLLTTQAMSTARHFGYPGVVLRTDDFRIPAVKMYYQLGFSYEPNVGLYTEAKWRALVDSIDCQ
jgi:GNAT superfamily N-acetyltransferase